MNRLLSELALWGLLLGGAQRLASAQIDLTDVDIGAPVQAGHSTPGPDGLDMVAGGLDIGGSSDQLHFSYQLRSGNFDLKVRLQALTLSDPLAKAGLVARESLDSRSRFAAALATPSVGGTLFASRTSTGGTTVNAGFLPVNYPQTWLRLKRAANVFTGYASFDGSNWVALGTNTLALTTPVYVGFGAASRSASVTTSVEFRDFGNVVGGVVTTPQPGVEPPGPSNRRSGLVISEIMYHPAAQTNGSDVEFIELFNSNPFFQEIGGYQIHGDVDFVFPAGTIMKGGEYVVVARDPSGLAAADGLSSVYGPYQGQLSRNSGTVRLANQRGAVLFEVNYDTEAPWPITADGAGHSLVLAKPSYGERDPRAWSASSRVGGSPGAIDPVRTDPLGNVVINEILANPSTGVEAFLELYNKGAETVNLDGCTLTGSLAANGFVIPPGTQLAGGACLALGADQLGFLLKPAGDTLYLFAPERRFAMNAVRFGPQETDVVLGRCPNGGPEFRRLATASPGRPNGGLLVSQVVINEIMYHPPSNDPDDQFVELYNWDKTAVALGGWRLRGGVTYTFPDHAVVPAGGYAVVAKNVARLLANYTNLTSAITYGGFSGTFSKNGERLVLAKPSVWPAGGSNPSPHYIDVDEVTYGTGGRWGQWANGGGSSLELIDAHSDKSLPGNWADSDETAKAPWCTIEFTGKLDNGNASYPPNSLQILMQDTGECLVDDVEAFMAGKTNLVINGSFEESRSNWVMQGDHERSRVEAGIGYNGGKALHIRASGRGDPGANRIRTSLGSAMVNSGTGTFRAKVRWLRGTPEMLLRVRGNYLECAGRMVVPPNLGTPGTRNSCAADNAPPAFGEVSHWPPAPAANQAVVVTARLSDPDGITSVLLRYRADPTKTYSSLTMADNGTGGDVVAGDGIYSARLTGRAAGTIVAFYVEASDGNASSRFPNDAPARECLIRFGDAPVGGSLGFYRLWMTKDTLNRWAAREHLSNQPLDCTFVYGNSRVFYNIGAFYSGSPWHAPGFNSPVGNPCDYNLMFGDDDSFLGDHSAALLQPGNGGGDGTAQQEQTAYWIAAELGTPICYRRYINLYVNGVKRGNVFEDSQQPNPAFNEEWYPDGPDGDLHKTTFWYEFDDAAGTFNNPIGASLGVFNSGGTKKLARYRWNFRRRAAQDRNNDYTNLFALVDAVNTTATGDAYTARVGPFVDVDEWARTLLVEKLVGNGDSYGNGNGQNMYFYKPNQQPWQLIIWDIDFAFAATGPTGNVLSFSDAPLTKIFANPPFARSYWRAISDAYAGPLQAARMDPMLDAKYNALKGSGITISSPSSIKSYITQRRAYLKPMLAKYNVPFKITTNNGQPMSSGADTVVLKGAAPLDLKYISINGTNYLPAWTSITNWSVRVPLGTGTNGLTLTAVDPLGRPMTNAAVSIQVVYTGSSAGSSDQVLINEWMAANKSAWADPVDAKYRDWIELYNPDSQNVNLAGWRLANSLTNTGTTLPAGLTIDPKGFLLVWADPEVPSGGSAATGVHVGFKLDRNGEGIALWTADGRLADYVQFGAQMDDISQGRYPDGVLGTAYLFMPEPTPAAPNLASLKGGDPNHPRFTGLTLDPQGRVVLRWLNLPGCTYTVQFKEALADVNWQDLITSFITDGSYLTAQDPLGSREGRYYRLVQEGR